MRFRNIFILLPLLFFPVLSACAQTAVGRDAYQIATDAYQRIIVRNNAIDLVREVGKRSSELTIREKIELRLDTSIVLWRYDEPVAVELLKVAWQDTFSNDIHNEFYADHQ